jgi:hypothetical protein
MQRWLILLVFLAPPALALDHGRWNQLLEEHVTWVRDGSASVVDYNGFQQDRRELKRYLAQLSDVRKPQYEKMNRNEKLAFLINAYNAFTVELVLRHYPDIESIKDIGHLFKLPWDITFFRLLGKDRKLNELEHQMIRVWFDEPRIHFVVNCASVGCPALRPEALTSAELEQQLAESTRRFLTDDTRNRFNAGEDELFVSPIFKWYDEDFEEAGGVKAWLTEYADVLGDNESERKRVRNGGYDLEYTDYDWNLNTRHYTLDEDSD